MTGLVIDESGFEVLAGYDRIGTRRSITQVDVTLLSELAVWRRLAPVPAERPCECGSAAPIALVLLHSFGDAGYPA